jgi:integrase
VKKNGELVSQKYIQNVLGTGFRKMCNRAVVEGELRCDPFFGLEWQPYDPPEADPFEPDERDRIIAWFAHKPFSFHAGRGAPSRMRPHAPFHAYVQFLFWHGARPSEASGLRVQDVDLKRGLAHVRQSFHMHRPGRPKTKTARRTIELHPETLRLFAAVMPLRPEPEAPLLCNTEGRYIHPAGFLRRPWRECLAALRIRHRGLYAMKDTFVTLTLMKAEDEGRGEDIVPWLVRQTGVAYETLKKHYTKFWPRTPERTRERYAWLDETLRGPRRGVA